MNFLAKIVTALMLLAAALAAPSNLFDLVWKWSQFEMFHSRRQWRLQTTTRSIPTASTNLQSLQSLIDRDFSWKQGFLQNKILREN
jgi:hypothetical protein